jgi:nitrate reductase cytochrome c-type subunit
MPWNSLTSTTGIAVMQGQLQRQSSQATADTEDLELTQELNQLLQHTSPTREEREAIELPPAIPEEVMDQNMEVGPLCCGTHHHMHAME